MHYFKNVSSYDDLKFQYRKLALEHHPDAAGGDVKVMQTINSEYDQLFAVWKQRSNVVTDETSNSTRDEFYTQNGWKGENYKRGLSVKEIANIVREFIKIHYNDFKFSVTTDYGALTQSLHIALMEGPCIAFKTYAELTQEERTDVRYTHIRHNNINSYFTAEIDAEIEKIFDKQYAQKYLVDRIKEAVVAVKDYANSFNYDDSDSMTDYFHKNFYFNGVEIGKWDKPYKVVERTKKDIPNVEYENVEVTKTHKYKVLEPFDIPIPKQLEPGQLFRLNRSFNYGCAKGMVYQIDRIISEHIEAYRLGKGYKNMRKGNIRGNTFHVQISTLNSWVEQGSINFVELQEVTKTEKYKSIVRRPKKQTGVSAVVAETTDNTSETDKICTTNKEYTITPDIDTRDNSPLWVVKFTERMEREDFLAMREQIKDLGGYYSRFKRGFIFIFDPTETLRAFGTTA